MEPRPATPSAKRQVLTDRFLKSLEPGRTPQDFSDLQQRGLIAWLLPSGTIQFVVRYRWQGKNRRHKLGTYSDAFTIAAARKSARAALVKVDGGHDPAGERQATKRATSGDTFGDLTADYLARHAKKRKRSWKEDERMLNVEVLPKWRTRKAREVSRRDVRDLVEAIAERGSPVSANRCLALIRRVFNHGIARDWVDGNVASLIEKPGAEVSRDRVLTDDEIRKLWRCLSNLPSTGELPAPFRKRARGPAGAPLCPISPRQAAILKLRLLTAQRGGEVAQMRWQDLDLADETIGWWTIPAEHAKNKQAHRVPLVGSALALVRAQLPKADVKQDESEQTPAPVHVWTHGETGAQDRAKKAPAIVGKLLKIEFRGHDLRRTAATKMAAAGIPQADIAKVLNHAEGGPRATQVYNRYQGDRERRIALETLERAILALLEPPRASATVVPIVKAR